MYVFIHSVLFLYFSCEIELITLSNMKMNIFKGGNVSITGYRGTEGMYKIFFFFFLVSHCIRFIWTGITGNVFKTQQYLIITSERFGNMFFYISHWFCSKTDLGETSGFGKQASVMLQRHWGISQSWSSSVHDSLRLFSAQMQNPWLTIIESGKIDEEQARRNVCMCVCSLRLGRVRVAGVSVSTGQEMRKAELSVSSLFPLHR